jgi:hypothetical protein
MYRKIAGKRYGPGKIKMAGCRQAQKKPLISLKMRDLFQLMDLLMTGSSTIYVL